VGSIDVVVRIRKGRRLGKRGKEGPSQGRWKASQRDEGRSHSSERIIITFFFKKKLKKKKKIITERG
jgi:hypothetical protein